MIHSVKFTCVLDTNIIYPIVIRDLLLWFAHYDLFTPKWSAHIVDELQEVMERKGFGEPEISASVAVINEAFPDALVSKYEPLIETLTLKDVKDRHVMAAAIKTNANLIVTNNLRDFPDEYLSTFGLKAKSADDFLTDIIDLNHDRGLEAFKEMVSHKKNPDMDEYEVLDALRRNKLTDTANLLHSLL